MVIWSQWSYLGSRRVPASVSSNAARDSRPRPTSMAGILSAAAYSLVWSIAQEAARRSAIGLRGPGSGPLEVPERPI